MPERDVALLLEDIVAAIGKIERYTAGLSRETFLADDRDLEIIWHILQVDLPQLKSQPPASRREP